MFNHVFSYCWKQFQGSVFESILWICFLGDTNHIYIGFLTHLLNWSFPFKSPSLFSCHLTRSSHSGPPDSLLCFCSICVPCDTLILFSLPAALIFFFYLSSRFLQHTFCSLCCLAILLHVFMLIFVLWFHGRVFYFKFYLRENTEFSPAHG